MALVMHEVIDLDEVWMVPHSRAGLDLAVESLLDHLRRRRVAEMLLPERLHRDRSVQLRIECLEAHAEAALPDDILDVIAAEQRRGLRVPVLIACHHSLSIGTVASR